MPALQLTVPAEPSPHLMIDGCCISYAQSRHALPCLVCLVLVLPALLLCCREKSLSGNSSGSATDHTCQSCSPPVPASGTPPLLNLRFLCHALPVYDVVLPGLPQEEEPVRGRPCPSSALPYFVLPGLLQEEEPVQAGAGRVRGTRAAGGGVRQVGRDRTTLVYASSC